MDSIFGGACRAAAKWVGFNLDIYLGDRVGEDQEESFLKNFAVQALKLSL